MTAIAGLVSVLENVDLVGLDVLYDRPCHFRLIGELLVVGNDGAVVAADHERGERHGVADRPLIQVVDGDLLPGGHLLLVSPGPDDGVHAGSLVDLVG